MVNRLVSVDSDALQFPADVRDKVADNLVDSGTVEGAALAATFTKRAVDDDDTPLVVTSGGETRILTPETAAVEFAPIEESMWLLAKGMDAAEGSAASYASIDSGHAAGWLLDDTLVEGATGVFTVPDHWTQITSIDVWWVPLTALGGNVVWSMNVFNLSHNNSLTSTGGSTLNAAASAASTTAFRVRVTSVTTTFTVDPAKVQRLLLRRLANDGSDTYVGDVALIGARIVGA